jgi:hypothetical protein
MPDDQTEAARKLQKLGERLRAGFAILHPAQHLDTTRAAVREQWETERTAKRAKPVEPSAPKKTKGRAPEQPEP